MKRRVLIVAAATALIALAIVLLVLQDRRHAARSSYQGKSIKDWALAAYWHDAHAESVLTDLGSNAVPELTNLLESQDPWWGRQTWHWAMFFRPSWRMSVLQKTPPLTASRTREAAAHALTILAPEAAAAAPALGRALRDRERRVGWEAATALSRIGAPALPFLTNALEDPNPEARHAAAYALGEMGPDAAGAVPFLESLLQDTNRDVRVSVAYSLSIIGTPLSALDRNIPPEQAQSRKAARKIRLMRDRTLRGDVRALCKLAQAPDPAARRQAIETLAAIHVASAEAIDTLAGGLADPNVEVRAAAARALSGMGPRCQAAMPALVASLRDTSAEVREWAARALGALGTEAQTAIPELSKLERDRESSVQAAAKEALAKITSSAPATVQK